MKNVKINGKTLKKLSMSLTLTCVLLGGCGNDTTEKTNDTDITEKQPSKESSKMSVEETQKLTKGQFVKAIDEKTPVIPDEATLEVMGLDYEYVVELFTSVNGGEFNREGEDIYWYHTESFKSIETESKEGETTYTYRYIVTGIKIIPIVYAFERDGEVFKKSELSDKSIAIQKLANPDNFEKLNDAIINAIS